MVIEGGVSTPWPMTCVFFRLIVSPKSWQALLNLNFINKEKSRDVQEEERKLFLAEGVKPHVKKKISFTVKRRAGNIQPTSESRTKRNRMKEPETNRGNPEYQQSWNQLTEVERMGPVYSAPDKDHPLYTEMFNVRRSQVDNKSLSGDSTLRETASEKMASIY